MSIIAAVGAREILDSRGNPTVEVDVLLDDGAFGRAAVPSGASTGAHEAVELRDGGKRYLGKGVLEGRRASSSTIARRSSAWTPRPGRVDRTMLDLDGTANKAQAGRQRDPRRLPRHRQGRGASRPAAALPLRRRAQRPPRCPCR